ncbi:MAG TPA: hypothetical protein VIF62_26335 [Labilithrix sp.]|jgi:hypothetical protein
MRRNLPSFAASAILPLAAGAAFWLPSMHAARGYFPAPLDDVYIHFDFARSLAEGHPFEWIPGNGYSSGETSPLYAAILAVGWLVGFRGRLVGVFAAMVAIAALAVLVRSVFRLVSPSSRWVAWAAAAVPLSIGLVDWALFSGMEVAVFAGTLGCALVALDRTRDAPRALTRASAQWRLGAWCAALVLLRPEAVVIVFAFAIVAARGAGARSGLAATLRAALPGAIALALLVGANVLATGDAASAGARLKLLSSNPYLSDVDRARAFAENLLVFGVRVIGAELSPILVVLAIGSLVPSRTRAVGAACLAGATLWILVASWNGNSPYHNFRYYAPALLLLAVAAALALAAIARTRRGRLPAAAFAIALLATGVPRFPAQTKHFARAVGNVRDQQLEVGARIAAATPRDARVLLGDAGAIPFVSGRAAIDALGLGGFHRLPFARAAVNGEAATIELIERLDPRERPTHLALYPNWFGALTGRFGVEIDRVTIVDNLICGGPTKGIYRADWSTLAAPDTSDDAVDEIDVADVISESDHSYVPPLPFGRTTLDVLVDHTGAARFDGGREIPPGAVESFIVRRAPPGRVLLRMRVDAAAAGILARVGGHDLPLSFAPQHPGAWREASVTLDPLHDGETIVLVASAGPYRNYHVWLSSLP